MVKSSPPKWTFHHSASVCVKAAMARNWGSPNRHAYNDMCWSCPLPHWPCLATTYDRLHLWQYLAKLCASSPRPTSCRAVISSGHGKGEALHLVSPQNVLHSILRSSAAVSAATGIRRGVGDPRERTTLADCLELMDLSLIQLNDSLAAPSRTPRPGFALPSPTTTPVWMGYRRQDPTVGVEEVSVENAFVALEDSGNFTTVQAAVDLAPNKGKVRYVIYVKQGTYEKNVNVGKRKTNLMITGDGMNKTTIIGSLNVVDGSTTFNSATLVIGGEGFIPHDIYIQNTAGPEKQQVVALRVGADKSAINRCMIEAYQDTLYTHSLRYIVSGTVSFIFGNAAVVFQNYSLNLVTAQGWTDPNQNTGTSVQNCRVVPSADLAPVKGTILSYLGRPRKEYSRTVFLQSYLNDHIAPRGWLEWSGTVALDMLFHGEYNN
ncbi:hypothetical protein Taro_030632 [Colocasia esculenta]|uniref:Pectinesterase catalytic domain-containing protein n=1 Tax=Colocasia esculenta TaxID=4460 RepID=A0A843VUK2_COLES|nr:hypothetical protein [Colocasia esculenta]